MQTKLIATTGEIELEQQINSFIIGKNVVDIKFTEWVSYQNQTGGYTAYILYEQGKPEKQVQVKLFASVGNDELESKVNAFIYDKQVVDIKYYEWVEYEAETGGYTALVMYFVDSISTNPGRVRSNAKSAPQFDVL